MGCISGSRLDRYIHLLTNEPRRVLGSGRSASCLSVVCLSKQENKRNLHATWAGAPGCNVQAEDSRGAGSSKSYCTVPVLVGLLNT